MKSKERELDELVVKTIVDFFKNPITLTKNSVVTISKTPEVSFLKYDITDYLNFNKYNEDILFFEKNLTTAFKHCDLSNFYQNLKTLKFINRNTFATMLYSYMANDPEAIYFVPINAIKIYGDKKNKNYREKNSLMHELLHMSSTYKDSDKTFSGFKQTFRSITIGLGINEGYTEYLNEKYFSYEGSKYYSYLGEKYLIKGIEKIVGDKEMEQLYFSANLKELVTSLERYSDKERAFNIITEMDNFNQEDNLFEKLDLFEKLKTDISIIYRNKLDQNFTDKMITNNEYNKEINFLNDFHSGTYITYGEKVDPQRNAELDINVNDSTNLEHSSKNGIGVHL